MRYLYRNINTEVRPHQVEGHIDSRRDAGRSDDFALVDEPLMVDDYLREAFQLVQCRPVSRSTLSIEQPCACQYQGLQCKQKPLVRTN